MGSSKLNLKNIGPETEKLLADIGVTTRKEFEKLGAEKVYLLLLEAGHKPDQDLRFTLLGAEKDMDWHIVAEKEKRRTKSRFADVDEA